MTEAGHRVPAFYDKIPANSPYVLASLKPFPMDVIEPYLKSYGDLTKSVRQQINQAYPGQSYQAHLDTPGKFMIALLDEVSKADSVEGMKQLGLSDRPEMAIYGIGWFPVMRLTLGNTKRFKATLSRIETKSGVQVEMRKSGKQTYRQYDLGGDASVAVAITDGQLVLGVAPTGHIEEFVAYMLGQKDLGRTLADVHVIQDIRAKYSFTPYAVGYVNIADIARTASGAAPADKIMAAALSWANYQPPKLTEVCRKEYMSLVDKVPRAVMGYTKLTPETMEVTAVLETKGDLAKSLAAIGAPIPGYSPALVDKSFFAVGLGIDIQKTLAFVQQEAAQITNHPFQCPALREWNQMAQRAQMSMQMVPPVLSSLRGALAVVTNLQFDQHTMRPQTIDGMALVQTNDPMGLFSQLRQMIPQLQSVNVKPNGVPVALQAIPGATWLQTPHIAMDKNTLAASAGVGVQDDMAVLLEDKTGAKTTHTPLLLVAYDYGQLMSKLRGFGVGAGAANGAFNSMMSAMQKMFGTLVAEIDANDRGIVFRYRINMFPKGANAKASTH